MFVRNGQKLGSVLVDEAGAEPQPRKRTSTKKAAARQLSPDKPSPRAESTPEPSELVSAPGEASDGDVDTHA